MTDKLNLTTPYLAAVLHALIDPERTDFEIRHLDLGRARSVWVAALRREIAGLSAREAALRALKEDHEHVFSTFQEDGTDVLACRICRRTEPELRAAKPRTHPEQNCPIHGTVWCSCHWEKMPTNEEIKKSAERLIAMMRCPNCGTAAYQPMEKHRCHDHREPTDGELEHQRAGRGQSSQREQPERREQDGTEVREGVEGRGASRGDGDVHVRREEQSRRSEASQLEDALVGVAMDGITATLVDGEPCIRADMKRLRIGFRGALRAACADQPWQPIACVLCPVCHGRGYVPNGFYASTVGQDWSTSSTIPDGCRSCQGAGYIALPAPPSPAAKETL